MAIIPVTAGSTSMISPPVPGANVPGVKMPPGLTLNPTDWNAPLGPDNLLPWQQNLDPQATLLGAQMKARAHMPETYSGLYTGVDERAGIAANPAGSSLAASASPMSTALERRAAREGEQSTRHLKTTFDMSVPLKKQQDLTAVSDVFAKQKQIELANFKEQYAYQLERQKIYQAQEDAKAQVLGTIFGALAGLAGTAIGFAIAGPVGAAVGGSLGSSGAKVAGAIQPRQSMAPMEQLR